MSCESSTSISYSTSLRTIVFTSTRNLAPVATTRGHVRQHDRTDDEDMDRRVVKVTRVSTSLVPIRTYTLQGCYSTPAASPIPSSSSSSSLSPPSSSTKSPGLLASQASSSTALPTSTATGTSAPPPNPAVSTPSSIPHPSLSLTSTASTSINGTKIAGAVGEHTETPMSRGTIGGLTAGGVGVLVLLVVALWWIQRQFRRDNDRGNQQDVSRGVEKRYDDLGRTRSVDTNLDHSKSLPSSNDQHLDLENEDDFTNPRAITPYNPWAHSRPDSHTSPVSDHAALPSPTPATLDTRSRVGSLSRQISKSLRSWAGPNISDSFNNTHEPTRGRGQERSPAKLEKDNRRRERRQSSLPSVLIIQAEAGSESDDASMILPSLETIGSATLGRMPSMIDLREIGRGMEAITYLEPPRTAHLAPVVSGDRLREGRIKGGGMGNMGGGLPPPPMRSNSLNRKNSKNAAPLNHISGKVRSPRRVRGDEKAARKASDKRLRGSAGLVSPINPIGRVLVGNKQAEESRGEEGEHISFAYSQPGVRSPSYPTHPIVSGPSKTHTRQSSSGSTSHSHRPPDLNFTKEAKIPFPISASTSTNHHPKLLLSAFRTEREPPISACSAYDGMIEIGLTPRTGKTPRTSTRDGRELPLGRSGGGKSEVVASGEQGRLWDGVEREDAVVPRLPYIRPAEPSAFDFEWETAIHKAN